jgi:diguanylate cyclase (GGDEF)-like protein
MDQDRRQKQHGLALATSGLAVALTVIAMLDAMEYARIATTEWALLVAAAAVVLGSVWVLLERGGQLWRGWDPHFVLVPSLATALLLSAMVRTAPEVRMLVLLVWPVVLIFCAGYIGFRAAALMSALMTAGYLAAVVWAGLPGTRLEVEALVGGVFLVTSLYACVVLSRIRKQRLELAAARAELSRLALTDSLTGLANRRHFDHVVAAETSRRERHGGALSLAILDVDHFKHFNDRYGHPAGDTALQEFARMLREHVRVHDTVARVGGEEFAVVMVGADADTACGVAERLRRFVALHRFAGGAHLSVSIGVATAPDDGSDASDLVRSADRALYMAKAAGRDTVVAAAAEDEANALASREG